LSLASQESIVSSLANTATTVKHLRRFTAAIFTRSLSQTTEHSGDPLEPSFSVLSSSIVSVEEDFFVRVERMSSELDGLVRFLRRGVESLAGGTGEAAPAFGVLAFALEDWDI
jgi:hypothetical protein